MAVSLPSEPPETKYTRAVVCGLIATSATGELLHPRPAAAGGLATRQRILPGPA
jgi:hypothetical protein